MAGLRAGALAAAILWSGPAVADPLDRWAGPIAEASARFGIPAQWIRRVMRAESGGRTHLDGRPIVSRAGAMGLMQLMPGTWREMRSALGLGHDPHQPRDNILAGTAYLRAMYDRFGYPGLFAAYNAGPARYAAHLATGRRLPRETVAYVASVAGGHAGVDAPARRPTGGGKDAPGLFVRLPGVAGAVQDGAGGGTEVQAPLFVRLRIAGH
jgi:soluble lytic murein transglycosylase-like protein